MGLFDSFKNSTTDSQATQNFVCPNEQSAWLGILTAAANANNDISDPEVDKLSRTWFIKSFFDGYDMIFHYKPLLTYCYANGSKKLIDSCAPRISEENKECVLCTVLDLIASDGLIDAEEKEIFEYIATTLRIPEETSKKIVEVFMMFTKWNKRLS